MTTGLRLTVTLAFACFAAPAFAQLPVAPEPGPTLDELVKEYQRCGLPIPPKNAELVRFKDSLGFRDPAAKPGAPSRCLVGTSWEVLPPQDELPWNPLAPQHGQPVKPTPDALKGVSESALYWFCLAAQCKIRGWDDLATAAYGEGRREHAIENAKYPEQGSITENLRRAAWHHWKAQLTIRGSDRQAVSEPLSYLASHATESQHWMDKALVDDLKLTIAPRKSKPGSIEALIDDLMDDFHEPCTQEEEADHRAYWKLVELGFDAVPALLEHAEDTRLTRSKLTWVKGTGDGIYIHRVGDLVRLILESLSGGRNDTERLEARGLIPAKEYPWWKKAQKVGEERWLLDTVLPPPHLGYEPVTPDEIVLWVIRVKYPNRLGDVYRKLMSERPKIDSEMVAKEIVTSKLPLETKLSLLKEGVAIKGGWHSENAVRAITDLTVATVAKRLLAPLVGIPGIPQ